MSDWDLIIWGLVAFTSSIMSGIAGGGAAFILTPLAIFLGLSPAQAVATGKFGALAITVGSLSGMRKAHGRVSKARVVPVMILALLVGLAVPFFIKMLDNEVYRVALGVALLLMIPVMIAKDVGIKPHHPTSKQRWAGGVLLTIALFLQGVLSAGLGVLVNVVLMSLLGMTALEANITKRWSALILNITIVFGVIGSGLVDWRAVVVASVAMFAGGYIGGRIATHKGDQYIMRFMIVFMAIAAVALIAGV
jgi:uncharacterized protein